MAYRVRAHEAAADGIRRIAREQIARAVAEASDPGLERDVAIHEARKRCKRLRALLRLARDAFPDPGVLDAENAAFRDAARALSGPRDAQVMVQTYDALMRTLDGAAERERFAAVRRRLALRRRREATGDPAGRLSEFAAAMRAAAERAAAWRLEGRGFEALAGGFARTYRRGRKAFAQAYDEPTPERFHEWRMEAKYHLYHVQLLTPVWRSTLGRRATRLERLTDDLGDEHDLTVFERALADDPAAFGDGRRIAALVELIQRRRAELRHAARPLGTRLYRERPKALAERVARRWDAWADVRGS